MKVKKILVIAVSIVMLFSLTACGKKSEENLLIEKNARGLEYLDITILSIINKIEEETDWQYVQTEIEKLYTSWNTIILDLYKLDIDKNDILSFSSTLDVGAQNIKAKDKAKTIITLANLYSHIPKYMKNDNETLVAIMKTKAHIIMAYSIIEADEWNSIADELALAEEKFLTVVNDIEFNKTKKYHIEKTYVMIKELQNTVDLKDKDIFYIKYKNLIEEINVL